MRYSIDLNFPRTEVSPDRMGEILALALQEGFKALGHESGTTVTYFVEKMRQHRLDLDKPVGEKQA